MDRVLISLQKRFLVPLVVIVAILAWMILCHAHYRSYWYGTIYRVQTTDFNILHHTLPPTLSRMIMEGRSDLVQKTLDSTYGLFGLAITDPDGGTVLWQTGKVYHRESWHHKLKPEMLKNLDEPYDLLTAPATLEPAFEHASPRSMQAEKASPPKYRGKVLGRLYYLRADPPAFMNDLTRFLTSGFWEMSGAKRGYLYVTLATVAFSLVVLLVVWLRQRAVAFKQQELVHTRRELEIRKKALEHLSAELASQKSRKIYLEREAEHAYKRALGLKKSLEKLRDSLIEVSGGQQVEQGTSDNSLKVRPAVHPPSAILEEIEGLLPGLSDNAQVLKQQAGVLHDYCATLEQRQAEMRKIVEHAYDRSTAPRQQPSEYSQYMDMTPR